MKEYLPGVVLAILVILAWFYLIKPCITKIKNFLNKVNKPIALPSQTENINRDQNREDVQISEVESTLKDSFKNPFTLANKVTIFMRERHDAGEMCSSAIQSTLSNFSSDINERNILEYVCKAGYSAEDLAGVMQKWNYSPEDVSERISEDYNLGPVAIAKILLKVFSRDTDKEKLDMVFEAFEDEELEDIIPEVIGIFGESVPITLIIDKLYENSDLPLGEITSKFNHLADTQVIVEIIKTTEVDIMDSDEYKGFRDNDFLFEDMAKILKLLGKSAREILEVEHEYDSFDFDDKDHRDSPFISLRPLGFSDKEIIEAISSIDIPLGGLVLSAVENNVSLEDIVNYLRPEWGDDPDGLWEELEDDLSDKDIIEIIYALIPPEQRRWNKQ